MLRPAATCSSTSVCARQCMYFAGDDAAPAGDAVVRVHQLHERVGLGKRHGFSSTALTTEKIAMLTPMPSVSAASAVAVNSLFSRNMRQACLMSLPQRFHPTHSSRNAFMRIDACRAARRQPARDERRAASPTTVEREHDRDRTRDSSSCDASTRPSASAPATPTASPIATSLPPCQDHAADVRGARAERHAHADLADALATAHASTP